MLRITEFMADNDGTLLDSDGDSSDWLEIYNSGNEAVDLTGIHLTDSATNLTRWTFPSGHVLDPGAFLIVFASNKNRATPGGEVHTNFALSAGGEFLALVGTNGVTMIDQYAPQFPAQLEDISYGRQMQVVGSGTTLLADGATAKGLIPTNNALGTSWIQPGFNDSGWTLNGPTGFGFENNPGDSVNFTAEIRTAIPSGTTSLYLRIPFTLNSLANLGALSLNVRYDDGFAAYINGTRVASANAPDVLAFNSTAGGTHDDGEAEQFVPFDVSSAIPLLNVGQNVLAIHALNVSSTSSDMLISPMLVAYASNITQPVRIGHFTAATPGWGNVGVPVLGYAAAPTFSVPHGFYNTTQIVTLTTTTPQSIIVYTTNGSTPRVDAALNVTNGTRYTAPLSISSTTVLRAATFRINYEPSFVTAASYLFLNDIIHQSPNGQLPGPGWATSGTNGQELSYGMDPEILALYGEEAVKASLASLTTFSITTDLANLFHPVTGIYVNAVNRGRDWERLATVELIDPSGQQDGFTTNAGLRIRGGYHRNDFNQKHAFRLYFRSEYGDGLLDYPLFGDEGVDRFDVLDLRTSQNYSWAAWGNSINGLQNSYLREVFARDTQADMGQPYTRSRYVHLYVDGQYWGLYMTQERIQEHYGETYFGGDKSDYDVVKSDPFETGGTEIADGNDVAWRQLFDMAQALANNPAGAADDYWAMQGLNPDGTRNESLPVLLDVDNLIDYMMIIIYTGGHDTGISAFFGNQRANNWFGIRNRETADQGFQFFLHDNEHSLAAGELVGSVHGTLDIDRTGPFYGPYDTVFEYFNPVFLHQDLLVHPGYVQRFVERVQELMFNDGPLTVNANIARMTERKVQVEPAIIAEAARWGDAKRSAPYTKADWDAEVAWLLNTYFQARSPIVLSQLQADGLYLDAPIAPPIYSQNGGVVPYGFTLTITGSTRVTYFTTDGSDPRAVGGAISPTAVRYSGPVVLTSNTTVKARSYLNGSWSPLR